MSRFKRDLRFLGSVSGSGNLVRGGEVIARVSYEFDGYAGTRTDVTAGGEVCIEGLVPKLAGETAKLQLVSDNGSVFTLRLLNQQAENQRIAHVDIASGFTLDAPS